MNEARIEGKLAADQRARFEAAFNFALGSAYNLSFSRDGRTLVRSDCRNDPLLPSTQVPLGLLRPRGMSNNYFQQSDVADQLRGEFLRLLQTDLAKLTPQQIQSLLGWTMSGRIELKEPIAGRKQLDANEVPERSLAEDCQPS